MSAEPLPLFRDDDADNDEPRGLSLYDPDAPPPKPDWEAIAAAEVTRVEIPEAERATFAAEHTLREFYTHPLYGLEAIRRKRVDDGTLAAGTLAKDRQALNRWERYSPKPAGWLDDQPWHGRPLAYITDQHVNDTLGAMRRNPDIRSATCESTWGHLRTIFKRAVEVRAIENTPKPTWGRGDRADRKAKEFYDDDQLTEVYTALNDQVDLQVAFVVSVNAGPRTVDLFLLRWENLHLTRERPALEYTAKKTGKRHVVPLAAVTVRQIQRRRKHSGVLLDAGLVWPSLTDAGAKDPERSRAARRRNERFKATLTEIGITHEKPWQVGRLTCNERLERHQPGSGQFILGHDNTLNCKSYREPSGLVYEAVTTLPQPECFQC